MFEYFDNILTQGPLVQGGLALMIAGWLGYRLRALPARAWEIVCAWTTRVVEIREAHPHYEAWLALLTENAVRTGGPRTLELRVQWDSDGNRLPTPRLLAGTDQFWARVHGKLVPRQRASRRGKPQGEPRAAVHGLGRDRVVQPRAPRADGR